MESLQTLAWMVVKSVIEKRERKTFTEIRKEMKEGGKPMDDKIIKNVEKVAVEAGWMDVVIDEWKIQTKKEMWRDIHRAIVSTDLLGNTMEHMYRS